MDDLATRLLKGERFPFVTLRYLRKETKTFLDIWWKRVSMDSLDRPYTLYDSEPILQRTSEKSYVDTISGEVSFPKLLRKYLEEGRISRHYRLERNRFRDEVVDCLAECCPVSEDGAPTLVFTGGGYGAGKTTTLQYLATRGVLGDCITLPCMQGVDYCKQLIPEFNMVKAVADGRASEICQDESRIISDLLFERLIRDKRCFSWDSSMSNQAASVAKIEAAKSNGYRVILVAVFTDPDVATRRAMSRAKTTQRFAHPDFLAKSHYNFQEYFEGYWEQVDEGFLVENSFEDEPRLLWRKLPDGNTEDYTGGVFAPKKAQIEPI